MTDLMLVKIGGSLITDKTQAFTPRPDVISRIAKEIHEARTENGEIKMIVGHGGGSFPHRSAAKYQTHKGIVNDESCRGISKVHNDATKLNTMFIDALIHSGENAISIPPAAICITDNDKIVQWGIKPIELGLKSNLLPVPYGDVVLDFQKGCTIISTEVILDYLARQLGAKRVIIAGKVDGVFTGDPTKDSSAKLIPVISSENFDEIKKYLAGSDGVDVTGGMVHKVEKMLELAKYGIESEIINADKPGVLKRALMGERGLGTIIR
jgi:isopentenyl phosphate kinase